MYRIPIFFDRSIELGMFDLGPDGLVTKSLLTPSVIRRGELAFGLPTPRDQAHYNRFS